VRKGWLPALTVLLAVSIGFSAGYLVRGSHTTQTPTAVTSVAVVPNVLGMTGADATAALEAQGFTVATVLAFSNAVPLGAAVAQDPAAGTNVRRGSQIVVRISSGPLVSPHTTPSS